MEIFNPEKFGKIALWLQVAKDEVETIITYTNMYGMLEPHNKTAVRDNLDEIIGDELNHTLIGLLSVAVELGIKIPQDNLRDLLEKAFDDEDDGDEGGDE